MNSEGYLLNINSQADTLCNSQKGKKGKVFNKYFSLKLDALRYIGISLI